MKTTLDMGAAQTTAEQQSRDQALREDEEKRRREQRKREEELWKEERFRRKEQRDERGKLQTQLEKEKLQAEKLQYLLYRGGIVAVALVACPSLFWLWGALKTEENKVSELNQQVGQDRVEVRMMASEQADLRLWLAVVSSLLVVTLLLLAVMICVRCCARNNAMTGEGPSVYPDYPVLAMSEGEVLESREAFSGTGRLRTKRVGRPLALDGRMGSGSHRRETWNTNRGRMGGT